MQVNVGGLPFSAGLDYAMYTESFVMLTGNPHFDPTAARNAGPACPYQVGTFPVSDEEVLADKHMMTGYVSDAVLKCMMWALHEQGHLSISFRAADVREVRTCTAAACRSTLALAGLGLFLK